MLQLYYDEKQGGMVGVEIPNRKIEYYNAFCMRCPHNVENFCKLYTIRLIGETPETSKLLQEEDCEYWKAHKESRPLNMELVNLKLNDFQEKLEGGELTPNKYPGSPFRDCGCNAKSNTPPESVNQQEDISPSLLAKGISYVKTQAQNIANGLAVVDNPTYEARLAICAGDSTTPPCEHYNHNHCKLCGCKLAGETGFTSKLKLPHEKCPVDKWGPVQVSDTAPTES